MLLERAPANALCKELRTILNLMRKLFRPWGFLDSAAQVDRLFGMFDTTGTGL
jgi:hypothetical protein